MGPSNAWIPKWSPPPDSFLPGVIFGEDFEVLNLESDDTHSCVYSVRRLHSDESDDTTTYVARVYKAVILSPSLQKYRARSIKRLARRTVWKGEVEGFQAVVFKQDPKKQAVGDSAAKNNDHGCEGDSDEVLMAKLESLYLNSHGTEDTKSTISQPPVPVKTDMSLQRPSVQQQESRRLRQRDRRRAKKSRASKVDAGSLDSLLACEYVELLNIDFNPDEGYRSFTEYVYQNNPSFTARVPTLGQSCQPGGKSVYGTYKLVDSVAREIVHSTSLYGDAEGLEPVVLQRKYQTEERSEVVYDTSLFVDAKDREVVFLQRQFQKIQNKIMQLDSGLKKILEDEDEIDEWCFERHGWSQHRRLKQALHSNLEDLKSMRKSLQTRLLIAKRTGNLLRDRAATERHEYTALASFFGGLHNKILLMEHCVHEALSSPEAHEDLAPLLRHHEQEFLFSLSSERARLHAELDQALDKANFDPGAAKMKAEIVRGRLVLLEMFEAVKMIQIGSIFRKIEDV